MKLQIKFLSKNYDHNYCEGQFYISKIPTANLRLILHRYTRQFILNPTYRRIKELLKKESDYFPKMNFNNYSLSIKIQKIYRSTIPPAIDIDNCLKILLDGIIEPIIGNDNKISEIYITR